MSDPVVVYGFTSMEGVFDISPFVHKLELYLVLGGVPYEKRVGDARKAPRGKLPYIEHDGQTIPDSQVSIEYLRQRGLVEHDDWLDPDQRAEAYALRSMLEVDLYFVLVYMRWKLPKGWAVYQHTMYKLLREMEVPGLLQNLVLRKARSNTLSHLSAQGTGRRAEAEIAQRMRDILTALDIFRAARKDDGPWWFGPKPSGFDTVVHAFFAGLYRPNVPLAVSPEEFRAWPALLEHMNHVDSTLMELGVDLAAPPDRR